MNHRVRDKGVLADGNERLGPHDKKDARCWSIFQALLQRAFSPLQLCIERFADRRIPQYLRQFAD
jgi:hypothetical protein